MNVLHGYIPTVEFTIASVGETSQKQITSIMENHKYVDFIRASQDPAGGGIKLLCSLLPYGIQKIGQDVGVQRIPAGDLIPSIDDIIPTIQSDLEECGFKIV